MEEGGPGGKRPDCEVEGKGGASAGHSVVSDSL